jgi:TRAP-type C4-dicarboxylate transport system permease small subunit
MYAAAKGALARFRVVVDVIARLILVLLICLIIGQIAGRYIFNYSIAWIEETARLLQIYLAFVGGALAYRRGLHIRVTSFVFASRTVNRIYPLIAASVATLVLAVLCVGAIPLMRVGVFQTSPATQLPLYWNYLAIYVGSLLIFVEIVADLLEGDSRHTTEELIDEVPL